MNCFISSQELEALGEGLSRDYMEKSHRRNSMCFDIEGFITDYLGLSICYESFAEDDISKIGFLANGIIEYLSKILSAYGVEDDNINKNFTLQNGYEILRKTFSRIDKLEYIDSLAVTNIDDMVEYIFSLSSMTSLNSMPKQVIKEILINNTTNGILNVPKEYGMFIAS